MLTRRAALGGGAATAVLLARSGVAYASGSPGSCSTPIKLSDLDAGPGPREYSAGPFLAFQAVTNRALPRSQLALVCPDTFPAGTTFEWTWPSNADDTAKSWNAIDFGDYLNTRPQTPIKPIRLRDLSRLVSRQNIVYEAPPSSGNVTIDFFLYRTPLSGIPDMVCEVQVFLHVPAATRRFIDGLPSLGTYMSPAIGGVPPIRWTVGRQEANFFRTPYFLLYPSDSADRLAIDFDIKSLLDWLRSRTPPQLTGEEYFTGLGVGVEPLKGQGSIRFDAFDIAYA